MTTGWILAAGWIGWLGLGLLSLVFFANALGVIDQQRVSFLKNAALVGGLTLAATWRDGP